MSTEFVPYSFQLRGVRKMERWGGRALLAFEQGLGKSPTAAFLAARHPDWRPVVVVCPAHLKHQWQRELRLHFGFRSDVLEGQTVDPPRLSRHSPFQVINYDVLPYWVEYLKSLRPTYVIGDEVQTVCNRTAKRTKAFKELCRGVPHVAALSGTPILNRPAELFPILNILQPKEFPAFHPFAQRYCNPKRIFLGRARGGAFGWDYRGASNLEELHQRLLDTCLIRIRKEDVLKDLPPKRKILVPVDLEDDDEYRTAEDDYLRWVATTNPARLKKAQKAKQISQMGSLRQLVGVKKLKAELAWVDDFLAGGPAKLCIFAWHTEVIARVHQRYERSSVVVDGSVKGAHRQAAVDRFLRDPKTRLFVGNIKAAGTGWSAKGVSDFAFFEYPWQPADFAQCMDRGHGIGRGVDGVPTTGWCLLARGSVEEHLLSVLKRKQKILSRVLDGGAGGDDFDVYQEITERMLRARGKL